MDNQTSVGERLKLVISYGYNDKEMKEINDVADMFINNKFSDEDFEAFQFEAKEYSRQQQRIREQEAEERRLTDIKLKEEKRVNTEKILNEYTNVYVKFEGDYADEFYVNGFVVVTSDSWKEYLESLNEMEFPIEKYFGTNESMEFESAQSYLDQIDVKGVTDEEFAVFKKFFGKSYSDDISFGKFFWLDE
jgi:hypothetical protein